MAHTYDGKQPYPVPHALAEAELPGIVQDFVSAAQNAMKAGFDLPGIQHPGRAGNQPRRDVTATYTALVDGIADLKPAYLSILHKDPADDMVQAMRHRFGGLCW